MTTGEPAAPRGPGNGPLEDYQGTSVSRHDAAEELVNARGFREVRMTTERLAAQVATITTQLAHIGRAHTDLAGAVSEDLAPRVDALQQLVTEEFGRLRGEVDVLLSERQEREKARNPPIN